MMRARLRFLVTSFNRIAMDYALARLEVALENPSIPAPPLVNRLGMCVGLDDAFATKWPAALAQVGAAADYVARGRGLRAKRGLAWTRLSRAVRMIAQFAQNIEWVGIEHKHRAAGEGPA